MLLPHVCICLYGGYLPVHVSVQLYGSVWTGVSVYETDTWVLF